MKNFTKLTKAETKEAELSTTPIVNFLYKVAEDLKKKINFEVMSLHRWVYQLGDKTNAERKAYLISKLGKPNYHENYEYREAVWGLRYKNQLDVIVYYSLKGFSVQVESEADPALAVSAIKEINDFLTKKNAEAKKFNAMTRKIVNRPLK